MNPTTLPVTPNVDVDLHANGVPIERWVRAADVVSSEVAGQVFLMSLELQKYFALQATSARIWELLALPRHVSEIVGCLVDEYDIDAERCAAEVGAFVDRLLASGLVRRCA